MYVSKEFPLYLDSEHIVDTIEPDKEFIDAAKAAGILAKVEEDAFPFWVVYEVLRVIGKVENLSAFANDDKFANQVREALKMLEPEWINQVRRYIAERRIGFMEGRKDCNLFFENVVFGQDMTEWIGLPKTVEWDSNEYKIWFNFVAHAAKHNQIIRDLINMTNNEHLTRYREMLLRSSGEKRLLEIHEEVTPEYNKIVELINKEKLLKPFKAFAAKGIPAPPEGIRQLINGTELLNEGQAMHHCVASYVDRCLSGDCYIFHVSSGKQHATLEVSPSGSILQFKSYHNAAPAAELHALVNSWLK
jgi:hypothetical protein